MKGFPVKHNFRRGASLMIALVIFLLCALAGASAFYMAASNAGRFSHKSEQEYYTVSSAALMLVDMLDDLKYTSCTVNYDYERTWDYTGGKHISSDKYTLSFDKDAAGKMNSSLTGASTIRGSGLGICGKIQGQCDELVPFMSVPDEWYDRVKGDAGAPEKPDNVDSFTYTFTVDVKNNDRFGSVNCSLVMNANYDLILSFQGEEGDYAITVYWVAELSAEQKTGDPEYVYTSDSAKEGDEYVKGYMTQKRTLVVTAKWKRENVTISRGEAYTKAPAEGAGG